MPCLRIALIVTGLTACGLIPAGASGIDTRAAEAAYRSGDYAAAADLYDLAFAQGDGKGVEGGDYYDAACAKALAGRPEAAFEALSKAVANGMLNREHMERDTDLTSLRTDPRWNALLAEVDRGREREKRIWGGQAFASPYRDDLPPAEKEAGLARVWAEARSNFANFDLVPELDWDAAFVSWLPKVRATASTADYYRELQAFLALLRDGHTGINLPAELRPRFLSRPPIGTRRIEGKVLVTQVFDEELLEVGVAPGLEILAIDGEPVEAYADRAVRPYQAASTPHDLDIRVYFQELLRGAAGSRVRLRLADAAGTEREVELERWPRERLAEVAPAPPLLAIRPLANGILHVELNSFDDAAIVAQWNARWEEIAAARGLILDLRQNGGGNSGNGFAILGTLVDRPFLSSAWRTRLYRPSYRAWGRAESWHREPPGEWPADPARHFAGPVAVLIGARTYSAAEDFAVAFDVANRGWLVGEPTGGSTGQPLFFTLPGGGGARVCTKRDTYPDGREFVGVGVSPDRHVAPTVADTRANRDPALVEAIEILRSGAPRPRR
jgi:C-terminal processing protease CtpA/Prc